jgi:hypothetical protein
LTPLVVLGLAVLVGAAPADESPDDLIRAANAAYLRGDAETADRLYAAAEERTADPGLVAFNRAAVLFQRGEFGPAEQHYARVLEDKACPPDRAARAWFNRGTCLLRLGGNAKVYRLAITCFERCLDLNPADEPLKADARHNLELAKLLWVEANKKAPKPEKPNDPPPEPDPPPAVESSGGMDDQKGSEPDQQNVGMAGAKPVPQPATGPMPKSNPAATDVPAPGNNPNVPVLKDNKDTQPRSPEETRALLKETEARLQRKRELMNDVLRGPDRPGVRDW